LYYFLLQLNAVLFNIAYNMALFVCFSFWLHVLD